MITAESPTARKGTLATDRAAETLAVVRTGPSFAAALVGFLSTTLATTILVVLIGTVA